MGCYFPDAPNVKNLFDAILIHRLNVRQGGYIPSAIVVDRLIPSISR
jgi:hypothetical protein